MARMLSRRVFSACAASSSTAQSLSSARPELDFDFLLDEANREKIRENVRCRKGIGDIDLVHDLWNRIQDFSQQPVRKEDDYKNLWDQLYREALLLPNNCHPEVVEGDESCAKTVRTFGGSKIEGPSLVTAEDMAKSWRSVVYPRNTSGSRSYAFVGPLAELERALVAYVWSLVLKKGFRPVTVSDIVARSITDACGLQQRTDQGIRYYLEKDHNLCLSGTSEMGISNMLRGRVFREKDLPLELTALSRCYRPEISKSAHEARLYRVHEFTKVEMFVVCKETDSDTVLQKLVDTQCSIFEPLGLHCRLLDMPSEELGAPTARKFDVEAWMPGRRVFGEISSASNCTDFQARRLGLKYVDGSGRRKFVHTCNGTAVATSRTLIALLETYQKKTRKFDIGKPLLKLAALFKKVGKCGVGPRYLSLHCLPSGDELMIFRCFRSGTLDPG